jgi:hypothetical protein
MEAHEADDPELVRYVAEWVEATACQQNPVATLGDAYRRAAQGADTLSKLARYMAGIERSFYRALHELQRLQAARRGERVPPPLAADLDVHLAPGCCRAASEGRPGCRGGLGLFRKSGDA